MNTHDYIEMVLVQTTTATMSDATCIGQVLLQQKLAACVQYETIYSQYCWQDKIESTEEIRLSIKTLKQKLTTAVKTIIAHHPYECPQITATAMVAAEPYATWLQTTLTT